MLNDILKSAHIWQGHQQARRVPCALDTGFQSLNEQLPTGGWPQDGITEVIYPDHGMGELSLLLPALKGINESAYVCLLSPPHELHHPALARHLNMSRTLVLHPKQTDVQWTAEQVLRSGACGAVIFWPHKTLSFTAYRRLQILCLEQRVPGFLFMRSAQANSPCRLRISVHRQKNHSLNLNILKAPGHVSHPHLSVEINDSNYLRYPVVPSHASSQVCN